jgi:hypothetical protein
MPNRPTNQHSPSKSQENPGKFSPDDDEAQEADVTHAADMPSAAEDEEAEDDEDDADGLGARPD